MTDGLEPAELQAAIARLVAAGATSACVAEAFATEDDSHEATAVAALREAGLPACASSEMSGLYGLELRTVTAAINASVLPIAVKTAGFVETGVAAAGIDSPVMVMRGDGGATDLAGFRREPARTLYSGPAASVAGVLRFTQIADGIVVEIGGTSTNVAAIKSGQPTLSYVQVASHATALRALDVRVIGVAGGSILRGQKRGVYGVGPRSAHISGLPYACFASPEQLDGARAELTAPRPGDTPDHVVITCPDGTRLALTNTCAANLLGSRSPATTPTAADAARAAFEIASALLRLPAEEIARRMLVASGGASPSSSRVIAEHELVNPTLVAVGGGAGGLGRHVAQLLGLECLVPEGAEVISSIGDALSLVRAECELAAREPTPDAVQALSARARDAAIAAGAAPARSTCASSTVPSAPHCARSQRARLACTPARSPDAARSTWPGPPRSCRARTAPTRHSRSGRSGSARSTRAPIACSCSTASATPSSTRRATSSRSTPDRVTAPRASAARCSATPSASGR